MNLSCGSRTIKYLIFTFNFFFVITGIILIAVGASIHAYYTQYNFFLNSEYFSLPNLLIATGTLIFIICFLGCYGAIKNSWIMLMGFSVLLGIIFIFEFSAGIAGYVLRNKTGRYLEEAMSNSMKDYSVDSSASSFMWDLIQREYECCGITNYNDWRSIMNNTDLPISCCPAKQGQSAEFYCNSDTGTTSTTTASTITTTTPTNSSTDTTEGRSRRDVVQKPSTTPPYSIGCEAAFGKWVRSHAVDIGVVCFTLAVLQLIGIGFACHLSKQLKNSYYST
ncbi:CD63 antigen [Diorhabda carinulata]|uniref:CD63 antigen n=1 Tax=Diorhabda carinulata TaxID=1163345 RepID=UPI0025A2740C|nr:CD63 antigen [Diorhabda carinulata]